MRKVLVTGATGFLGYHIINSLLNRDIDVIATANDSIETAKSYQWYPLVKYIPFDILSDQNITAEDFDNPDGIIHLAWYGLPNYNETYHITKNEAYSKKFLNQLIESGLRSIAVSGTCFEYGNKEGCLNESMLVEPVNQYAIAKDNIRKCLENNSIINLTWGRFFYIYGRYQSNKSLTGQLQTAIAKGERVFNMSPGDQLRDFIEVDKAAEIFIDIFLNGKNNGVVNICSGKPVKVLDFVKAYLLKQNYDMELNAGYYPYSQFEPMHFWGSVDKMNQLIDNTSSNKNN